MMMALGMFIFNMHTVAYQTFEHSSSWRHAGRSRVGARDAYQFLGAGDETVSLPGWIAPGQMGSKAAFSVLYDMANTGKAWTLVDGKGSFFGLFFIEQIMETASYLSEDGQGRKVEFSISLKRVDDDLVDQLLGDLSLPRMGPSGTAEA